eukprot:6474648-Amphidinium_carterae.1
MVHGGSRFVRPGSFAARALARVQRDGSLLGRKWRETVLDSQTGKASPVTVRYTGRVTSRHLLLQYAKQKKVGVGHLTLIVPLLTGHVRVSVRDKPIRAAWQDRILYVHNGRPAAGSRRSKEQRIQSEEEHETLWKEMDSSFREGLKEVAAQQKAAKRDRPALHLPRTTDVPLTSLSDSIGEGKTVKLRLICSFDAPSSWTISQAFDSVRSCVLPERCVFAVDDDDKVRIRLSLSRVQQVNYVQGGGKYHRVQVDAVASTTVSRVLDDLQSCGSCLLDPALVEHLMKHDRKCALACFQSRTASQRARALSAGLRRMGLAEKASGIESLLFPTQSGPPTDVATQQAAPSVQAQAQHSLPANDGQRTSDRTQELLNRIKSLEIWAHTWDSSQLSDAESGLAATRAHELLEAMAKQVSSEVPDRWMTAVQDDLIALRQRLSDCEAGLHNVRADAERVDMGAGVYPGHHGVTPVSKEPRVEGGINADESRLSSLEYHLTSLSERFSRHLETHGASTRTSSHMQ